MTPSGTEAAGEAATWNRIRMIDNPYVRYGLIVIGVIYILWSVGTIEMNWTRFTDGIPRAVNMFSRMIPPDFSRWNLLVKGILESIQMALAASVFGMLWRSLWVSAEPLTLFRNRFTWWHGH